MGGGLLACLRLHPPDGGGVVRRDARRSCLGAEDVPMAQEQAARRLSCPALGGGAAASPWASGVEQGVPGGVRLPGEAAAVLELPSLPSVPPPDREWSDGGGVQDGVHTADEAGGDDV